MSKRLRQFFGSVWVLLTKEHLPVWLTLALTISGATMAYLVAPVLNQKFEIQTARREFVVESLNEFGTNSKQIIDKVHEIIRSEKGDLNKQLAFDLDSQIAQIQYQAVELTYVLPEKAEQVVGYQRSLATLKAAVGVYYANKDTDQLVSALKDTSEKSLNLYAGLLETVGFKLSPKPMGAP
jgi:hypothetical protein